MTGRVLRRRVAAAVAIGLVAILTASVASASAMSLTGSKRQYLTSAARCSGQAVAASTPSASGTSTSVKVSNLDASACAGKTIVVTVYDGTASTWTAAKRFEATSTVSTASTTLVSAAYTPTAALKAYVTIGGWPVPATWSYTPADGCEVRNANGNVDTTKPCSVSGAPTFAYWGSSGSGQGNFSTNFSAPGITNSQYVTFHITLIGAPSWWSWSNAGLTGINNSGTVTSSCSALPTFSGRLQQNVGASPNVYVSIVENRTGTPGIVCTIP